jgi:pimeloyl-ACP methyl ester carboxylesterase
MKPLILLLIGLIAVPALAYFLFPGPLFRFSQRLLRRRGNLTQKSVKAGGIDWPYLDGGNPAGEPLVLVHGFGGDKDNWSYYAPQLKDRYRIIAPDLPGFGEATRDPARDYSVATQADRLAAFLDALGIARCHLGGNSMGGFIALLFALKYPERLRSLTLFNNAGIIGTEPSELQDKIEADPAASPLVPRDAAGMAALLGYIVHKPRPIPGRFLDVLFAAQRPHLDLLDSIFRNLATDMLERPLNDRLGEVRVPTQIIWGRHDRLIHYTSGEVQHAGIAGSELVIFEHIGHVPMIEDPAATASAHRAFLAKH